MADIFPIKNRATDLQIDFFYLRRHLGRAMGYGINHTKWTDFEEQEVLETMDDGVRQYYYPPPLMMPYALAPNIVHEWSFLRPIYKFQTASGQREYLLPENFEEPVGHVYFQGGDDDYYGPIKFTNALHTMKLENRQEEQSPPKVAALKPADSTGEGPQGQILILHPTPDSTYNLQLQYQTTGRRLTEEQPFPLGGQTHGPGILASCLAAAELRTTGAQGPRYMKFQEVLAGNIARDYQRNASVLGYNGNGHNTDVYGRGELRELGGIFYNDVDYGGYMS